MPDLVGSADLLDSMPKMITKALFKNWTNDYHLDSTAIYNAVIQKIVSFLLTCPVFSRCDNFRNIDHHRCHSSSYQKPHKFPSPSIKLTKKYYLSQHNERGRESIGAKTKEKRRDGSDQER